MVKTEDIRILERRIADILIESCKKCGKKIINITCTDCQGSGLVHPFLELCTADPERRSVHNLVNDTDLPCIYCQGLGTVPNLKHEILETWLLKCKSPWHIINYKGISDGLVSCSLLGWIGYGYDAHSALLNTLKIWLENETRSFPH